MQNFMNLFQIIVLILLIILPPLLMAALVRIGPIYQLTQRNRSTRLSIVLGNGLLYLLISYGLLLWLVYWFYLSLEVGFGGISLPVGVTIAPVVNEIWLRHVVPGLAQTCLSAREVICQTADMELNNNGSLFQSMPPLGLLLLLTTTVANIFLSWRFSGPLKGQKKTELTFS